MSRQDISNLPVVIVPYQDQYRAAFQRLNELWIEEDFEIEEADRRVLQNPQREIIDRGGFIFIATLGSESVGVCALMKRQDRQYPYELAKMAVSPSARGRKVGWRLGQAVIDQARSMQAKRLFLESNTKLEPAIRLYEKLGFVKVLGPPTPYARCNIQMQLEL